VQASAKTGQLATTCPEGYNISQGSVETHLRCGAIFDDDFITNLLLIPNIKNIDKILC